jgi:hypothetical protein
VSVESDGDEDVNKGVDKGKGPSKDTGDADEGDDEDDGEDSELEPLPLPVQLVGKIKESECLSKIRMEN